MKKHILIIALALSLLVGCGGQEDAGLCGYTIRCVDQNGDPVPGVMLQICDASSCRAEFSDEMGLYSFSSEPCAWEIHILVAPEGYSAADSEAVFTSPLGGEVTLVLNKE